MYSTSLGNSVMTSTSCSRGRQKLRFQISRKVRTARDKDRDCKEAPREAEPSRAAARAGAETAGGSCSHHGAQRSKGPACAPSKSVTLLCTSLCEGSHSRPSGLSLYPPAPSPAQALCSPPTSSAKGLPRSSLGQTASPGAFQQGELIGVLPPGTPHPGTGGAALGIGLRSAPAAAVPGARGGPGRSGCSERRQSSRCLPGCHHGTPEVTQPRVVPSAPRPRAKPSPARCPLPAEASPATLCQLTGRLRAGGPPFLRGLQGGKGELWRGRTGKPAAAPRPAPGGPVPVVAATSGSGTGGPGCPRSDPAPVPRLSPGRAVPPAPRPAAAAGRRRAAASPLPPPRYRLGAATTALPPPACRLDAGPPAPPCRLRRRRAMGARPAPLPYFTATAPPPPRPGPAAGREQVPGPGGCGDGRCSRARRSPLLQRPRTASGHASIGLPRRFYSPPRAR